MNRLPIIYSSRVVVGDIECAGREQVGVVCLPEADVDVEGGGEGGNLHVVGPFARLAHLFHMFLELLLQLFFCVIGGVDTSGGCSSGLAFRISSHVVDSHVLTVEV